MAQKPTSKLTEFKQAIHTDASTATPPPASARKPHHMWQATTGTALTVIGAVYVWLTVAGAEPMTWKTGTAGALGAAAGGWLTWTTRQKTAGRIRTGIGWMMAATVGVILLGTIGAATSVVVDGTVYLATSPEARSYRLVLELKDDLISISEPDRLLAADLADARSRYNQFQPAAAGLREMVAKWSNYDLGTLPDPDFVDVIEEMKVAGTFGAIAVEQRFGLLSAPDARTAQDMQETRRVYVEAALTAGQLLERLAVRYGVELIPEGIGE